MASEPDAAAGTAARETRYEGFADYTSVSRSVAQDIENAVDAYAMIQSRHSEGARVTADQAAEAAGHILGAALKLLPELEADRETVEEYDAMLGRWQGDDGFIERVRRTQFTATSPEWLGQFAVDIRRAGFMLGYLKAGREVDQEAEDIDLEQAEAMMQQL
jgi:hypothetical protein